MNLSHFEPLNGAFVRAGENCILMASLRVSSAENHSLTKDVLCAALHCEQSMARLLLLSALRGVALVHDHYQVWHPWCLRDLPIPYDWPVQDSFLFQACWLGPKDKGPRCRAVWGVRAADWVCTPPPPGLPAAA